MHASVYHYVVYQASEQQDSTVLAHVVSFHPQVQSLQAEVDDLHSYQARLQDDYEELQSMAEARQQEIEILTHQINENLQPEAEGISQQLEVSPTPHEAKSRLPHGCLLQEKYAVEIDALERQLQEKQNIIEEKEEDIYALNDKLQDYDRARQDLRDAQSTMSLQARELMERRAEIEELRRQLATPTVAEADASRKDLLQQIEVQEEMISELRAELEQSESDMHALRQDFEDRIHERIQEVCAQQALFTLEVIQLHAFYFLTDHGNLRRIHLDLLICRAPSHGDHVQ